MNSTTPHVPGSIAAESLVLRLQICGEFGVPNGIMVVDHQTSSFVKSPSTHILLQYVDGLAQKQPDKSFRVLGLHVFFWAATDRFLSDALWSELDLDKTPLPSQLELHPMLPRGFIVALKDGSQYRPEEAFQAFSVERRPEASLCHHTADAEGHLPAIRGGERCHSKGWALEGPLCGRLCAVQDFSQKLRK